MIEMITCLWKGFSIYITCTPKSSLHLLSQVELVLVYGGRERIYGNKLRATAVTNMAVWLIQSYLHSCTTGPVPDILMPVLALRTQLNTRWMVDTNCQ